MSDPSAGPATEGRLVLGQLREVLSAIEEAFARGTRPEELMPLWYDDEVIVTGEGDACAARGMIAQIAKAQEMLPAMGPRPIVTFRIEDSVLAQEALAVALIDARIRPDVEGSEPIDYRMMTAWRRGARGWRIIREMYGAGSL